MSNEWLRLWHGTATDSKLSMICKRAGARRCEMTAVWECLLDHASNRDNRGFVKDIDLEVIAFSQEIELDIVKAIFQGLIEKIIITSDGYLSNWKKRQPDREDPTAAERKRNQRAREKEERDREKSPDVTQCHALVTEMSHNVTTDTDKTRQDKKEYITTTSTESARKEKIMDTLPPDLNLNDLFVSVGVVCCLFERKPLASKEQETISEWCTNHDMRRVIPLLEAELEKFREKNHKDPASIMYFKPIIAKLPKVNPLAQMTHDLAFRMRV